MEGSSRMAAAQDEPRTERRRYQRFRVLWEGQVVCGTRTRCVVLDISAQGAKLRLPNRTMLPNRFVISMPGRGKFDAELVELEGAVVHTRLLNDEHMVAHAVADIVPTARFLEETRAPAEATA